MAVLLFFPADLKAMSVRGCQNLIFKLDVETVMVKFEFSGLCCDSEHSLQWLRGCVSLTVTLLSKAGW